MIVFAIFASYCQHKWYAHKSRGFSLLEMLLVIALSTVLMTLALPNLRIQQASVHTDLAWLQLQQIALAQAEYFSINKRYAATVGDLALVQPHGTLYAYSLQATPNSYVAEARINQSLDYRCWRLTLDAKGVQTAFSRSGQILRGCF